MKDISDTKLKTQTKLCIYFAFIVFFILFITAMVMSMVAFFLIRNGLLNWHDKGTLFPITLLLSISVIIGTFVAFFVGRKIMDPITRLSNASKEVATGNFDIHLEERGGLDEIREMARNFNFMVSELSTIETLRNDFVVNVSHEFKTPISTIEGYATLLQEKDLSDDEKDEYIRMLMESAKQLSSLSGNILNLSKLESQDIIPDENEFRLDEQIRQSVLLLEKDWSSKNISMEIDLPNVEYTGDKVLLMQVWMNLLSNSIKFTPDDGTVRVHSFIAPETISIEISDTGCGMNKETAKKIFDKFYQGDTSRKSQGNGLGLPLTKRILDITGGTISVKSEPGEGSTFIVSLPYKSNSRVKS